MRTVRKEQNISFKVPLDLVETSQDNISLRPIVEKLVNIQSWTKEEQAPDQAISFRVDALEYFVPVGASNIEEDGCVALLVAIFFSVMLLELPEICFQDV